MMVPLVRCLLAGLVLVTGAVPAAAQGLDAGCAAAPTAACVLAMAHAAARSETGPGDRDVALMRVSQAYARLGDAQAISEILVSMRPGERADLVRSDLAHVLAVQGDALGAFGAVAGMETGWRREAAFAEIAGLLAAQGRRAEVEALGAAYAVSGANGPVRRGLLTAALGDGDLVQADALLAAMGPDDRAWFLPEVVAAYRAAGDSAAASRLAAEASASGDTLDALRLFVADQQTDAAGALLRRLAAAQGPLADALAVVVSGPQGDEFADLALTVAAENVEALGRAGYVLAANGHFTAARRVADRLGALQAPNGDATAAEAQLGVLWAIVNTMQAAGDADGALAGLTAIRQVAYTPLDNPFPDPLPRRRVEILISAGRVAEARTALAQVLDPFERAAAAMAMARSGATDAAADRGLLAEAAAAVSAVREVPDGFGGTQDAGVPVVGALSGIAGVAAELELETAPALAVDALSRIETLPEASMRAWTLAELAVALIPR